MHLNWHYMFSYTGSCNLVIQVVLNTSCSFVDVSELRVYLLKMRPFLCWLSDWNLLASVAAIPHYWQLFYSSFWQWSWEGFHVKKKLEDSECVTTADFLIPKAYQDQIEGGTLTEIQPGSVPVKGSWSRFPSPQRCVLHPAHKLHTCWWPSLDVASAMDNSILCFTFFYRAQAIPKWKGNTQIQIHTNNVNWHAE